jgi:hypothetical protein
MLLLLLVILLIVLVVIIVVVEIAILSKFGKNSPKITFSFTSDYGAARVGKRLFLLLSLA